MPEWTKRARQYLKMARTLREIARVAPDQKLRDSADDVARDYEQMALDLKKSAKPDGMRVPD